MKLECLEAFEQGGIPRKHGGMLKLLKGFYQASVADDGTVTVALPMTDGSSINRTLPQATVDRLTGLGLIRIRE